MKKSKTSSYRCHLEIKQTHLYEYYFSNKEQPDYGKQ